jgi:hypothetical protein
MNIQRNADIAKRQATECARTNLSHPLPLVGKVMAENVRSSRWSVSDNKTAAARSEFTASIEEIAAVTAWRILQEAG